MGTYPGAGTDFHIGTHNTVGTDLHIVGYAGGWINNGCRVNHVKTN